MTFLTRLFALFDLKRRRCAAFCRMVASDPLSHPDLARMSERDLGDLPFGRCGS